MTREAAAALLAAWLRKLLQHRSEVGRDAQIELGPWELEAIVRFVLDAFDPEEE